MSPGSCRSFICILGVILSFASGFSAQADEDELEPGTTATDRLGLEMVYVPAGTVEMGINRDTLIELLDGGAIPHPESQTNFIIEIYEEQGVFDTIQVPLHGYWIDKYEVTIEHYQRLMSVCMGTGRCTTNNFDERPELVADPRQPQVGVTWFDALRFCIGRDARLPTEYEWEYAASGPDNLIFPWGNQLIWGNISVAIPTVGTMYPVGSRPGNVSWVGAYDMAGNAAEWVDARLTPYRMTSETYFIGSNQPQFDVYRVTRGGSYYTTPLSTTTFARSSQHPETAGDAGIRCVRSTDPRE